MTPQPNAPFRIFTIGHSTRTIEEFVALLRAHKIGRLVDIRSIPRSRRNPQFNRETLGRFLRNRRIRYRHLPGLGGLRHAKRDSINTAWRNASFRGYADYMQTTAFEEALDALLVLAAKATTAIMCAEAVPWRCHRFLVGDALVARGIEVRDIFNRSAAKPHLLTPWARIRAGKISYPG